jgi:RNase H-fold protein (predicted Holliday junction resolvase)
MNKKEEEHILAVDPGRDKSGIAVLSMDSKVLHKDIIKSSDIKSYLLRLINIYNIRNIIMGDGTFSGKIIEEIRSTLDIPIVMVDETYTTMEAEKRYYEEQGGWKRFFPFIHWKPARPLDDYVAVVLGEKFLYKDKK